jgi:hypothetical protein
MNQTVEQIAAELNITAAEVNAMLSDAERAELGKEAGDTPVATSTQTVTDNAPASAPVLVTDEDRKKLLDSGKATAHEIEQARSASDSVARTVLLARAAEVAAKPVQATIFLEGFGLGLLECGVKETVVKVRKAEAKAVLEAYSKTITENLTEARKELIEFTGGYHAFILACRMIRGTQGHKAPGTKAVKTRLNESESQRAKDLLHSMSAGQAADAAVVIGNHLLKMQDGELAMIRLVANVYLQQLALSEDVGIAKWASDSRERAIAILEAAEKARPVAQVSDHTAHGVIPIPQPAESAVQQAAA